jgi:3-oxoacyl-(acyl-carrier-protein) synthase
MIRPCFLGSGIATHLGTGIAEQLAAVRRPPGHPETVTRQVDGRAEAIPYKLLKGFPLETNDGRLTSVVDAVVEEALRGAALTAPQRRAMALYVGSSSFDISESESAYRRELANGSGALPLRSSSVANVADGVRRRFDLNGEDFTFNTACTASANGLSYAARMIRSGAIEHALVLGVELINDLTALGFLGLNLLSRSEMRPFDARRDGLVLGEACSAVVLGPGDPERFHVLGGASVCDTHSMVSAHADGSSIAAVMREALASARLAAGDIAAVKAHGTANPANDDAEAAGLRSVFAPLPPVCALKPHLGHTLGASGLTELVLCYRAVEDGFLPATPGIGADDPATGIRLNQTERPISRGCFMLNSFGFGGSNTSLVIARS